MSTKATLDKKDQTPPPGKWRAAPEQAPSVMGEPAPTLARVIGAFGLFLVMVGSLVLLISNYGPKTTLAAYLGAGWGTVFGLSGLGLMLYHAALDRDYEMRRAYMVFGYLWLIVGAIVSVIPADGHAGARFLPYGFVCLVIGLLFLTSFLRSETDPYQRDVATYVLGAIGIALGVGGFFFGCIFASFLFATGVLVILLALPFWWAFVTLKGTSSDQGYYAGLGMGALGLLFFVIAFFRSTIPQLMVYFRWKAGSEEYLMPYGIALMACGALYFLVSLFLCSDTQLVVLTRKEFTGYFQIPLAYLVMVGFTLLAWYMFYVFVNFYLWNIRLDKPQTLMEPIVQYYLLETGIYLVSLLVIVPILTMRLISEEKRAGTLEMLFTSPVNDWTLVLSKFIAALAFFMLIHLAWGLEFVGLRVITEKPFDYRPLLAFFIALLFVGANLISMGLFFSSLTKNQLAAALITFVALLFLVTIKAFQIMLTKDGPLYVLLEHVSFVEVLKKALDGKLYLRDLIYQISAAVFWLFLTTKVLESRKWR